MRRDYVLSAVVGVLTGRAAADLARERLFTPLGIHSFAWDTDPAGVTTGWGGAIARRNGEPRVIPAGPTYKLRDGEYAWRGLRVFPSYVQSGPSFYLETSKRRMIAEDIEAALAYAG